MYEITEKIDDLLEPFTTFTKKRRLRMKKEKIEKIIGRNFNAKALRINPNDLAISVIYKISELTDLDKLPVLYVRNIVTDIYFITSFLIRRPLYSLGRKVDASKWDTYNYCLHFSMFFRKLNQWQLFGYIDEYANLRKYKKIQLNHLKNHFTDEEFNIFIEVCDRLIKQVIHVEKDKQVISKEYLSSLGDRQGRKPCILTQEMFLEIGIQLMHNNFKTI